jgi:hypothetical protein
MAITLRSKSLAVLAALTEEYGDMVERADLLEAVDNGLIDRIPQWLTTSTELRAGRGIYRLPTWLLEEAPAAKPKPKRKAKPKPVAAVAEPVAAEPVAAEPVAAAKPTSFDNVKTAADGHSFVPKQSTNYIPWGNSKSLKMVLESGKYMPVFITGLSGNGKTYMIEQEVARANRELFRVNINTATDEDDLLGGFRLVNGQTVWFDGPVIEAMKRGAVLLLDELDLGTERILCLQSVLEGKGVFIKKTNQWVEPAPGFTVVATGNTKGQGDDTNKFIGANVMNEAFLERFPVWLEQSYPTESVETRIVKRLFKSLGLTEDDKQIDTLIKFAQKTRKTYEAGGCDDLITTRRLCLIVELMPVFGKIEKAVEIACSRFCKESKRDFVKLFKALTEEANKPVEPVAPAAPADTASVDQTMEKLASGVPF